MLLLAVTVALTTSFAALVFGGMPAPEEHLAADLELRIVQDACPWGDGDERIQVRHVGGERLPTATTVVRVQTDAATHEWQDATLAAPFDAGDGLIIGETWQSPAITIQANEGVLVDVVSHDDDAQLVLAKTLTAPDDCTGGP